MSITGLKLRCSLASCRTTKVVAPTGGLSAGQMVKVGNVVGVAVEAADAGDDVVLVTNAPAILLPCATDASGYTAGEKIYFDATAKKITRTATSNTLCGIVHEAAGATATEVVVELDGALGIVA